MSRNEGIRKQQLIADPTAGTIGSTSTTYEADFVFLATVYNISNYVIDEANSYVGVLVTPGLTEQLVPLATYYQRPTPQAQSGYVKITWTAAPEVPAGTEVYGAPLDASTYIQIERAGVLGDDTHGFLFDYFPDTPATRVVTYRNFADVGNRPIEGGGTSVADFVDPGDGGPRLTPPELTDATVRGSLVPEPSAAAAVITLAAAGLLRRRPGRG